jgi:hypothetical protein
VALRKHIEEVEARVVALRQEKERLVEVMI